MAPTWLHDISIASLCLAAICAIIVAADEMRHPQHMWIMNLVWPITCLFGSLLTMAAYYRYGRLATKHKIMEAKKQDEKPPSKKFTPFPAMVAKGALHCGSGCTLGDITGEWLMFGFPAIAAGLGYPSFFVHEIYTRWILDYIFAYLFGILFQYFTIKPMRQLSAGQGIVQAVKADTLSLTAWQIGMYGYMALAHFYFWGVLIGHKLEVSTVEFWFMMQIAMLCGFATAYPVNWWLIRKGVKEKM